MQKFLDNKKNLVADALFEGIKSGAKVSVISAYFTIYAFEKLRDSLLKIDELRFLFVEPTFTEGKEESREFYLEKLSRERQIAGADYEIKLRNELNQTRIAKECADWIREKVEFRSLRKPDQTQAHAIHVHNPDGDFGINGTTDFTSAGLGFSPSKRIEMNMFSDEIAATDELLACFEDIWNDERQVEDVKGKVLQSMQAIYKENSPEFLYFVTLYNLFKDYLEDVTEENVVEAKTGIKKTETWNKLYKFQKDGVVGVINKLSVHGGCILADSVGLGKTFEALAVIKYHELLNHRVLVLCPKKLRDNWEMYRGNDLRNVLSADRYAYDILNHSDLTRERGKSGDINLATLNWGNYGLVVIDESHNFRNNDQGRDRKTRYKKLMDDIIKSGIKTKVLMLSATPVNNRLADLKNQIAFITEGDDHALASEGIKSIQATLGFAQKKFNEWNELNQSERTLGKLLEYLSVDYFKLLDTLTIARSRRHIEKYYDLEEVGKFPVRRKPENPRTKIDLDGEFPGFEEVNTSIRRLYLAIYSPLSYVRPECMKKYEEKYDIRLEGGAGVFKHTDREKNIINLMRVNILKRLESSIHSYRITLKKIDGNIKNAIQLIDKHDEAVFFEQDLSDAPESMDGDDEQLEAMTVGSKVSVDLGDMDLVRWKQDLESDSTRLCELIRRAEPVSPERDAKLAELKHRIAVKVENPFNPSNKKVIVFSAFADTASYLYANIATWAYEEYGIHAALITGSSGCRTTLETIHHDFTEVLTHFSPLSKEKQKIFPNSIGVIDLLIATDCVSEGQNLQDCDYLVNYDIHWNPVRIIQRFGRIDRIGSKNDAIQLINFWPDMELDAYINLEQRVRGRMVLLNTSATGEEDIINEQEKDVMNDIEYRKNQLERLQQEVLSLEDIDGNISITDMTLTDFRMELAEYMKDNAGVLERAPLGMHTVSTLATGKDTLAPGTVFVLRQLAGSGAHSEKENALHPYYIVFVSTDGVVQVSYLQAKRALDLLKLSCKGKSQVEHELAKLFNKECDNGRDMRDHSALLRGAIEHVIGRKKEEGIANIFTTLGKTGVGGDSTLSWVDDFELISFFVLK